MIKVLEKIAEQGNPSLYEKGCHYFYETLIPSLELITIELSFRERKNMLNIDNFILPDLHSGSGMIGMKEDKQLLADEKILCKCWELVGDIYATNYALKRATRAYESALRCLDTPDSLILKLVKTFEKTGKKQKAFDCINDAILFCLEGNEVLEIEKQRLQDSMNYDTIPEYTEDHKTWKLYEAIGRRHPEFVVEKLANSGTKDIDLLKCLANAYGMMKEDKLCVQTWQKIINLDEDFEIEAVDEFYTSKECWNQIIYQGKGLA